MPIFSKKQVLQYYSVLGLDTNDDGLIVPEEGINLEFITDLYDLNDFGRKLPYTYKDLSEAYGMLSYMIEDDFWYEDSERKEKAFNAALGIIDDLSHFDVEDKDNEDMTIDRKNNLKAAVINGLCSVGDLITFRMFELNSSFDSVYDKVTDMEKEDQENKYVGNDDDAYPEDLKKLYYLIAYSKFKNDGSDFEMFDGTGRLSLPKLRNLVKRNLSEDVPLNETSEREEYKNHKILRLSHFKNNNNNE